MSNDRYAGKLQRLQRALLHGAGTLDAAARQALAAAGNDTGNDTANAAGGAEAVPESLASFTDKVTRHAYKVTDEDIQALRAAGYSEDQIFEATLSIAFGAALHRLKAGLSALDGAASEGEE